MAWQHLAACRELDPEMWFPIGTTGPAERQAAAAKAVCRLCPVVAACLAWAVDTRQDSGIWGALDPDERRALPTLTRT